MEAQQAALALNGDRTRRNLRPFEYVTVRTIIREHPGRRVQVLTLAGRPVPRTDW